MKVMSVAVQRKITNILIETLKYTLNAGTYLPKFEKYLRVVSSVENMDIVRIGILNTEVVKKLEKNLSIGNGNAPS